MAASVFERLADWHALKPDILESVQNLGKSGKHRVVQGRTFKSPHGDICFRTQVRKFQLQAAT